MIGKIAAEVLAAGIGTVAFSVLFTVPRKYYPLCGAGGGAGWLIYAILTYRGVEAAEATFLAAMAVAFLARIFAVVEKCPNTLFLIPGIFPLVPGAGVYWTSYYIVTEELERASHTGFMAFKAAAAIVLGIVAVFEIPQKFIFKGVDRGRAILTFLNPDRSDSV